jgi:hypothetical protein
MSPNGISPVTTWPPGSSLNPVKKRIYLWSSVLAVLALFWLGGKALQAHKNLVTLDVRDADVRDVLKKIQWQTWETIVVHKDVKGKVTFNVVKSPLEEVLRIISDQTSLRISAVYPIYSKGSAYVNLRKLARGDIYKDTAGWTNFSMVGDGRGGFGGGPGGGFGGDGLFPQQSPVTLNLAAKDLDFATLALSRRANAQVIVENGVTGKLISLKLEDVPFLTAVEKVAKASGLKAEVFYSVQADQERFAGFGGFDDDRGGRRGGGTNDFGGRFGRGERDTNWMSRADERDLQRQREMEARLATMTAQEQAKAAEERQKMEELRNLPEEQRRQAFEQLRNNPQNQARMENRMNSAFKNATPEQRVERARRALEARKRREAQQGGGR